jgi:hypothetical protein
LVIIGKNFFALTIILTCRAAFQCFEARHQTIIKTFQNLTTVELTLRFERHRSRIWQPRLEFALIHVDTDSYAAAGEHPVRPERVIYEHARDLAVAHVDVVRPFYARIEPVIGKHIDKGERNDLQKRELIGRT